jgi:hypothetical protein
LNLIISQYLTKSVSFQESDGRDFGLRELHERRERSAGSGRRVRHRHLAEAERRQEQGQQHYVTTGKMNIYK